MKKELPVGLEKFSLENKVALITGAGSGLGKEVSQGMARSGATVVLLDMNFDAVKELSEEEWNVAREVVTQAVAQLMDFRRQEGAALEKKFCEKLDNIAALLASIEPYEMERTEKIRERILDSLQKNLAVEYDKNRFEQELIFYIEKLDINEEKQRLTNHLNYFRETMNEGHGQGKKLGFIAQEMGREINTTGSKSNLAEMQNIVVQMKDELEQIKEQVLNVM